MDEIRSFAGNKERQVRIFAAVEVGSRLWPSTSITESGDEAIETHSPSCATLPTGEELVITELGQVGTQFDGFAHQSIGNGLYNCYQIDETATRTGFTKLGVEKVGALMTRGVLIDVAAWKGVDMLPDTYEITASDLKESLARQNVTLEPGPRRRHHPHWLGTTVGCR